MMTRKNLASACIVAVLSLASPSLGAETGVVIECPNPPLPPPATGTCDVVSGDANLLIRGDLLTPALSLHNAELLIDDAGTIVCAGCDCTGSPGHATATQLVCAEGVATPGLINPHDHIRYTQAVPVSHGSERYDHRHEWRKGLNGHTQLTVPSNPDFIEGQQWGELRMVLGGATSMLGSGWADGMVRNLDANQEGLGQGDVYLSTFPLGDAAGQMLPSGCAYPAIDDPAYVFLFDAYAAHVAEGVGIEARNELLCLSSPANGGHDLAEPKAAFIHVVGINADDATLLANEEVEVVWAPRSNISLYGFTAPVTLLANSGALLSLGTDWTATGSMNLLRELRGADQYNRVQLGGFLDDAELVQMVTENAAILTATDDAIGTLEPGQVADVTIWNGSANSDWRAVIDAEPADVVLVLRGGLPLVGDDSVMEQLSPGCEPIDVCGVSKRVCSVREFGATVAAIESTLTPGTYPLFFCGDPPDEPTCVPSRVGQFTGIPTAGDRDGDGVADALDLCPAVFDPPRPMDSGTQADADLDGLGDACDPCPLDPDATCSPHSAAFLLGEGADPANPNRVAAYRTTGAATNVDFLAYGAGQWGVRVAAGDIDGRRDEILTGPGPGPIFGPQARAFERTGIAIAKVNFYAYGTLKSGVNVAAADVEGDTFSEIVTGPGPGTVFGPHVRVFNFDGLSLSPIAKINYFAYGTLKYGVNPSGGDLDRDLFGELVTGPGPGTVFGSQIRGWNYDGGSLTPMAGVNFNALPYAGYGANVSAGCVDDDGIAEIVVASAGPTHPGHFRGFNFDGAALVSLPGFEVIRSNLYGGRVGTGDVDLDRFHDLITGAGPDPSANSAVESFHYDGTSLTLIPSSFIPFPGSACGVDVAGARLDL